MSLWNGIKSVASVVGKGLVAGVSEAEVIQANGETVEEKYQDINSNLSTLVDELNLKVDEIINHVGTAILSPNGKQALIDLKELVNEIDLRIKGV